MAVHLVRKSHTPAVVPPCPPATPTQAPAVSTVAKPKRNRAHGGARPLPTKDIDLSEPDTIVRVGHMLTYLSVSSGEFYKRKEQGMYPEQDGYDGRPFWCGATVRKLLASLKDRKG